MRLIEQILIIFHICMQTFHFFQFLLTYRVRISRRTCTSGNMRRLRCTQSAIWIMQIIFNSQTFVCYTFFFTLFCCYSVWTPRRQIPNVQCHLLTNKLFKSELHVCVYFFQRINEYVDFDSFVDSVLTFASWIVPNNVRFIFNNSE